MFALIHSRNTDGINGWLVSKNLPEWLDDYSEWLTFEKQHANDTRTHQKQSEINLSGELISIPGSISDSRSNGGFDSDEGKASSEACSAANGGLTHKTIDCSTKFRTIEAPVAHKQNLLDDSEASFCIMKRRRIRKLNILLRGQENNNKFTLPVQMKMMGPRGTPTTCHNQHGASQSYSFGQI
jgi:hypothetical protein